MFANSDSNARRPTLWKLLASALLALCALLGLLLYQRQLRLSSVCHDQAFEYLAFTAEARRSYVARARQPVTEDEFARLLNDASARTARGLEACEAAGNETEAWSWKTEQARIRKSQAMLADAQRAAQRKEHQDYVKRLRTLHEALTSNPAAPQPR